MPPKAVPCNEFQRRVLALCGAIGWSLADLAKRLKMTRANISGILRHGHPSMTTVQKIAKALGVKTSVLIESGENKSVDFAVARSELAAARAEVAAARVEMASANGRQRGSARPSKKSKG